MWISLFQNKRTSSFVLRKVYGSLCDIAVAVRAIPWYEGLQVTFKAEKKLTVLDTPEIQRLLKNRYSVSWGNVFEVAASGKNMTVYCKKRVYSPENHVELAAACAILPPNHRRVDSSVFRGKVPFLLFRFNETCGVREFLHTRHMIELFLPGTQVETVWNGKRGNWKLAVGFRELKQFASLQ